MNTIRNEVKQSKAWFNDKAKNLQSKQADYWLKYVTEFNELRRYLNDFLNSKSKTYIDKLNKKALSYIEGNISKNELIEFCSVLKGNKKFWNNCSKIKRYASILNNYTQLLAMLCEDYKKAYPEDAKEFVDKWY